MMDYASLKHKLNRNLLVTFGKRLDNATTLEKYIALSELVMEIIHERWEKSREESTKKRNAYYMSAEFLIGRSLGNNLLNLGLYAEMNELLRELGLDLGELEDMEEDAALGNGGLGRLAACFMESAATKDLPLQGYGVRYNQGLFKQSFIDGFQTEEGDDWTIFGDPWSVRKVSELKIVEFHDQKVMAVPYDMPVIGYQNNTINTLRLWQAEALGGFDFQKFNNFEYDCSVHEKNRADDITRVLYPNDLHKAGKILRLKQQYFFVSASMQDIVQKYSENHPDDPEFLRFKEYHAIQLNDTHPVIAISELMRILMDQKHFSWEFAWDIVTNVFSFTNHTILAEAMERWSLDVVETVNPRNLQIIHDIDRQLVNDLKVSGYSDDKIGSMRIVSDNQVKMAHLAIYSSKTTNGVAQLHTKILKERVLRDWYELYPDKFQNKTNGITPRRWLVYVNPRLTSLINELLGSESWINNLGQLKSLEWYLDDQSVLQRLNDIKYANKLDLADYIKKNEGIVIDPNSIFDVQVKRLHEYKRQLLNAFQILDFYYYIKDNPEAPVYPKTCIFGAKAAPGYFRAKAIIKFINEIAKMINNDESIRNKLKVVFVQNFRVSYGERIYPAADISEQISTAGQEASGTGNMKFMLNGTPTLGTYDGANIEIFEEAGMDANYMFGAKVEELQEICNSYNPLEYYTQNQRIRRVVDTLLSDKINDRDSFMFLEIYNAIVKPSSGRGDQYYILKDFENYCETQKKINLDYQDRMGWARKCLKNIANAGKFSSDRTILQYASEIWDI